MRVYRKLLFLVIFLGLGLSSGSAFADCQCQDSTGNLVFVGNDRNPDRSCLSDLKKQSDCQQRQQTKAHLDKNCPNYSGFLDFAVQHVSDNGGDVCKTISTYLAKGNGSTPSGGDCMHAANFSGNLQGQNCQNAVDTVQNMQTRDTAVTALGTTAMSAASMITTMSMSTSTNVQADSFKAQQNILTTMAAIKGVQAANSLVAAGQLGLADLGAQKASKNMAAYQAQVAKCNGDQACLDELTKDLNLGKDAANDPEKYLRLGSSEAKSAGDAAGNAALTSGISGLVNGLMAGMAMNAAKNLQQDTGNMASYSVVSPGGGMSVPGVGFAVGAPNSPGGGDSQSDATLPGTGTGGIQGGLQGGVFPGGTSSGYVPATSTVSDAGGSMGTGGGGGSPNAPAKNQKKGLGATGVGEINTVGGLGRTPNAGFGKDAGPATGLEDAIKKLLGGGDSQPKKAEENRQLASTGEAIPVDDGSIAVPGDVTIFQQVTSKIHQLNNNGQI